jgi:hypothetical protein
MMHEDYSLRKKTSSIIFFLKFHIKQLSYIGQQNSREISNEELGPFDLITRMTEQNLLSNKTSFFWSFEDKEEYF